MRKVRMEDVFRNPSDWKCPVIDMSDPKVIELIRKTKEAQAECMEKKKVDWNRLRNTIVSYSRLKRGSFLFTTKFR